MKKGIIKVNGMSNDEDARKVTHAIKEVWGVRSTEVSLKRQEAKFGYNEQSASYDDFVQAIKDQGFTVEPKHDNV